MGLILNSLSGQGMSDIAAVILRVVLTEADAFWYVATDRSIRSMSGRVSGWALDEIK